MGVEFIQGICVGSLCLADDTTSTLLCRFFPKVLSL